MENIYLAGAARTPVGGFNGSLSQISATRLGSIVIEECVKRTGIKALDVDGVFLGIILSTGLGPSPARQSALNAGVPESVRAVAVNSGISSGIEAILLASSTVLANGSDIIVAGGMENMSRAPYLLEKARFGYRLGAGDLIDPIMKDCLRDAGNDAHIAEAAEDAAKKYGISRDEQDKFASESYRKALAAQKEGLFEKEIVQITLPAGRDKFAVFNTDEGLQRHDPIHTLPPLLEGGTITSANSAAPGDGAAVCAVLSGKAVRHYGIKPLARLASSVSFGGGAGDKAMSAANAIDGLLRKAGLRYADIDLFEINEDFAATTLAVRKELGIDGERLNVSGGAIAFGNPEGAAGARVLATLLHSMENRGAKRGVAAAGTARGQALALLIERTGEYFE